MQVPVHGLPEQPGRDRPNDASFEGTSSDGGRVFIRTTEALLATYRARVPIPLQDADPVSDR